MSAKRKLQVAAKELFFSRGIKSVSVEQISEEAGVSKMSFYRAFDNKAAIAIEILKAEMEVSMEGYRQIMESEGSFLEKMEGLMNQKLNQIEQMSSRFYMDVVSDTVPELREYFVQRQEEGMKQFLEMYKIAQENGEVRADLDLTFLPLVLNQLNKLSGDEAAMKAMGGHKALVQSIISFFLYGIAPKER